MVIGRYETTEDMIKEVMLLLKLLQTKLQVKIKDIIFYDLYHTVIKNRDDKEIVNDDEYENIENDFYYL